MVDEGRLEPCGVLCIDKPEGPTSHDVVAKVRRALGTRRVGHAGTLDPMASGLMVVLVGEATKLEPYLSKNQKSYLAKVSFGRATDTLDRLGQTTSEGPLPEIVSQELERIDELFRAGASRATDLREDQHLRNLGIDTVASAVQVELERTEQIPPRFSAIKVDGQKGYDRARRGEDFELSSRQVRLLSIRVREASPSPARISLEMSVTKGYYVRSFARDLGESLLVPSHLCALRRTRSGAFDIETAIDPGVEPELMQSRLVSLADAARAALTSSDLTNAGVERARRGQILSAEHFVDGPAEGAWFANDGQLVAIGQIDPEGAYRVQRGFVDAAVRR